MGIAETARKIGVFSHGGTKNLGDEALLAAVIQNVRLRVSGAEVIGFTINPTDTRARHGISCFPIRRTGKIASSQSEAPASVSSAISSGGKARNPGAMDKIKSAIKSIPGLRSLILGLRGFGHGLLTVLHEPKFLLDSYYRLNGVELLLVAGSQQLNDGYGGAWGFPFTLYKWTLLSKLTGTKVAILSVGAGPI